MNKMGSQYDQFDGYDNERHLIKKLQIKDLKALHKEGRIAGTLVQLTKNGRWSIAIDYFYQYGLNKTITEELCLKTGKIKEFSKLNGVAKLLAGVGVDNFKVMLGEHEDKIDKIR